MRGRRLRSFAAILVIVLGAVGLYSDSARGAWLAFCCCGPHDAASPCRCPDCPSAEHDDRAPRAAHRPHGEPSAPSMQSCALRQVLGHAPIPGPTVCTRRFTLVRESTMQRVDAPVASGPADAPALAPPEKPPRAA